jgi:RNA polymerase sigma-70 factor (ECF subfamily)
MIDLIRKETRQVDFEKVPLNSYSVSDHYSDLGEILRQAVDQLPDIQRSVVLLRDYEGYSYEEIGEITGLNESQVKVYIYRARLFLKKYIGSLETVI